MNPLRVLLPHDRREPAAPMRGDYVLPPRDTTIVKCKIVRACWVTLRENEPWQSVKPGQILQVPRWLANELFYCGQASLL